MSWNKVNLELVAKSIAELLYEEVLIASDTNGLYSISLKSNVQYFFKAKRGKWDFLQIDQSSIKRIPEISYIDAAVFFTDANADLGMSNITLSHFIEEMNNTLFSEMKVLENRASSNLNLLANMSGEQLQAYLSGHPKILLNKGRIGFSSQDLEKYAPEYSGEFQVCWLAVKKSYLKQEGSMNLLKDSEIKFLNEILISNDISLEEYSLIPVHPWQLDRYILIQYQREIANKIIISLGACGPFYTPQISIRTLTNLNDNNKYDIKLSLTILNTSAYRGISAENLECGPELSRYIENICQTDILLKNSQTEVLKEVYVSSFVQPTYENITDSPYRYRELLGCVVRESSASKLKASELAIMTGSLFYVNEIGDSLIGEYIKLSQVTPEQWVKEYFKKILIPLYHLQLSYGIGIVSHGQNIVLKLTDHLPSGMFIKDFQGDLRVNLDFVHQLPEKLKSLKALPANYLIHDLITGHLVTVLRFISPILEAAQLLTEDEFYRILSIEIINYLSAYHPDFDINCATSLLRPEFEKVVLNKVRFNIGYEDSSIRPLPLLGKNLINPIYTGSRHEL